MVHWPLMGGLLYLPVGSLERNARNDSADYLSMKKSIWVSLTRWSPALNELVDLTVTTSEGRWFHLLITRSEKKWLRVFLTGWCFSSFKLWPRIRVSELKSKNVEAGTEDWPVMILNTSTRSARLRRSSSDHNPSSLRQSLYGSPLSSLNRRVNLCWTLSPNTFSIHPSIQPLCLKIWQHTTKGYSKSVTITLFGGSRMTSYQLSLSCIISEIKRHYWLKIAFLNIPSVFNATVVVISLENRHCMWCEKTRMTALLA